MKLLLLTLVLLLVFATKGHSMTYEELTKEPSIVIRFTATWCPPCKALAPIFDAVAKENPEVKTLVIDVDNDTEIASKYGIKGIPTVMKVENGNVTLQRSGAMPKEEVEAFFK